MLHEAIPLAGTTRILLKLPGILKNHGMESMQLSKDKHHQIVAWALLGGLLFLRLPFLGGIALFATPNWLDPAFQIGTYLLTAGLIWWERDPIASLRA